MLFIYLELRYQSQLNRICPEILDAFLSAVSASVRKNGGSVTAVSGGNLYCFESTAVGYAFSASRAIADIRNLLGDNRARIREYFILVDDTERTVTADTIHDYLADYDSAIMPDEGIFITPAANRQLSSYIKTVPLEGMALGIYSGSCVMEYASPDSSSGNENKPLLSFHSGFVRDPVSVFRNIVFAVGTESRMENLSGEEKELFGETAYALEMFARSRFSPEQPEYRISACLDHFSLYFRTVQQVPERRIPITIYGAKPLPASFDLFLDKLAAVCDFVRLPDPVYLPSDLKNIPSDLLELSWLVYRAVQFLGADEFVPFFIFLGKKDDFISALGTWLYSYGILSNPDDFNSVNLSLFYRIESKLGERTGLLDSKIASFLWKKYEEGLLVPSFAFLAVLDSLHFIPPDSFFVSCLYHEADFSMALERVRDRFRNPEIAVAVEKTERAWKSYDSGDLSGADSVAREVLRIFQGEGILAGEYRVLSLIALLSLARNNGDDAIVYLEFALENAERMHDSHAELCTRFDMSLVHFILGNFHFSVCSLESVDRIVGTCYAKDWEVLVLFIKGRIAFELGDYRNAELYFQTAASLASVHQIPESVSLCRVWYARALVFQNRFATGQDILISCALTIPEAYLFLLEACLLSGRKIDGVAFPEKLPEPSVAAERWSTGQISWRSGFSMAEDRCFGNHADLRIASRMYDVLTLCYRSRFDEAPDVPDIVRRISEHAKNALEVKDPYAGIYYYFSYDLAARLSTAQSADATAFLSRAFKYLQKRANEIDDNAMREQYMQTPIWNSRLYRAARDNMLI